MNLKQAQKIVHDYGGFIEWALFRYQIVIFIGSIPESLLPYPPKLIEEASNIVAKFYHDNGDKKKVEVIQECMCWLQAFEDDEKSILRAVKNFNEKKFLELNTESIKGFRSNPNHQNHISGLFKDRPLDKVDFENPDFSTAHKTVAVYGEFLKYAHIGLSHIFCDNIPETLLPFPKIHLVKALDTCSIGDDKNTEAYTSGKAILEDYVDAELAISELIMNFSDKEKRESIISDIKKYQLKYTMATLLTSELI